MPQFSFFSTIILIGIFQGALLIIALLTISRGNKQANKILAFFLLLFVFDLITEFLFVSNYYNIYTYIPKLSALNWSLELVFGPTIYFYTKIMTTSIRDLNVNKVVPHLILFLLSLILIIVAWFYFSNNDFVRFFNDENVIGIEIISNTLSLLSFISFAVYLFLSIKVLSLYKVKIKQYFTYTEKISLSWLIYILISLATLFASFMILIILELIWGINIDKQATKFIYVAVVVNIYLFGYMGIKQPKIFKKQSELNNKKVVDSNAFYNLENNNKYHKSALSQEQSLLILEEIEKHLYLEKPYLDNQFSLPKLANQLSISSNWISQAINQNKHMNFFDFVNKYRIEEAKRMLKSISKSSETILSIAMNSGFNSKTAFNKAFKKYTSMTPSQYRLKHK